MRAESTLDLGDYVTPMVTFSGGSGPTVVITAGVHGDEVTGVAAARAVDQWLSRRKRIDGTVVLLYCLNPSGLRKGQRGFGSGLDLNRAFPGSRRGNGASRLAFRVWQALSDAAPAAVIDLHTDSPVSIPYVLVDRAVAVKGAARAGLEARAVQLAKATGLCWITEYPDAEYRRFQLDRSLAGAVLNSLKVPSITIEAGPKGVVSPASVDTVCEAVARCLAELGVVSSSSVSTAKAHGGGLVRAHAPRPKAEGLFVPCAEPGQSFKSGDLLGHVVSLGGQPDEAIVASFDGLVVSWASGAWVRPGMSLGTLGKRVTG